MNSGVILINKPKDFTSHDVVAKARGILRTKKIGHAGTLDPMATGVLPLFLNSATKAIDKLDNHDKTYKATIKLGITTDTQDTTGTILSQKKVEVSKEDFAAVLNKFKGEQYQTPPMYSAVQVNGQRLYDLARQGIEVERAKRRIEVYDIKLLSSNPDGDEYTFIVDCSKGTYIRTICHDIGSLLGCGAALCELERTKSNGFSIESAIGLEELQRLSDNQMVEDLIIPTEELFKSYQRVALNSELEKHFLNGVPLWLNQFKLNSNDKNIAVYNESGKFLGTAKINLEKRQFSDQKIF